MINSCLNINKFHDGIYKSEDGYYILDKTDNEYKFIPIEKQFNTQQLLNNIDTLNYLNENYK